MSGHPYWLPPLWPMSPWSEEVMEELYALFRRDFIDNPALYQGYRVWFFPERDRGKELIFWHLVEREDPPRSGNRLPDFRRCERLPWARAMLDNVGAPEVKAWDYEEGDGDVRTYLWLEALDYVIVRHNGKVYLFTEAQMRVARDRAMSQPEDAPRRPWWRFW